VRVFNEKVLANFNLNASAI